MREIVLATGNPHKFRELTGLLRVRGVRWRSLAECPTVRPVRETGRTFEANAEKKALAVARATGLWAIADDSGIEVKALDWAPGVRSARFAGRHGSDAANNRKLLRLLRDVSAPRRMARYRCVLALASPTRVHALTRGVWWGRIATTPAGQGGFGYDPIFWLPARGKTVAQLPASLKQRLSHRALAARRMQRVLSSLTRRLRAAGRSGRGSRRATIARAA
ncbi:MAG: non-canonical purine NTP pyrophosphatase, RdgB/HAM1 family [Candidatus Omnitrophica bacterium CG11_big_fil_rev_8_21_14_0_20_63_9]|nr:MAG: non-canonical purine NTP pyrophosphatase, RdgB/HAM1 family [Candidatus Omnitrophica bacterium CG11_big_fil_rev_8_21_14_0_20_63_9]